MEFCIDCGNMYYIKLDESKSSLVYYCRNCGYEDEKKSADGICVSKTIHTTVEQNPASIMNKYTKYDNTLPKITISCINADCSSSSPDIPTDIVSYRYDTNNMKYIYMCKLCNASWLNKK
jgi:DNA-directed RNA polymerase subunit M/transcription elongation factor TFIIS